MAYRVEVAPKAKKQIQSLQPRFRKQVESAIQSLQGNPRNHTVEKLTDKGGLYRSRSGNFRIVFSINDAVLTVMVVDVSDRKETYR